MSINFMKVQQPNMPAPEYDDMSISKSKYANSVVGGNNALVFSTMDNGAWQGVYPDPGYIPFRGTKSGATGGWKSAITMSLPPSCR